MQDPEVDDCFAGYENTQRDAPLYMRQRTWRRTSASQPSQGWRNLESTSGGSEQTPFACRRRKPCSG